MILAVAVLIFAATLVFIIRGRPHRTVVTLLGAIAMVLVGTYVGFYPQGQATQMIDWDTLGLLLGMMIMVGMLRKTGFFRFLAVWGARASRGSPWMLLVILGLITAFVSMIIDNVTTILLMAPVTVFVCDALGINPVPFMLSQTFFSNVGGVATLVGDPPNIMIGSAAGLDFNSFIFHLMPIALVAIFFLPFMCRALFPSSFEKEKRSLQETAHMVPARSITDAPSLKVGFFCLVGVVALFVLEPWAHLKPAFVALMGAACVLALTRFSPHQLLEDVDWPTLLFFASLFVVVGGLEKSGFIRILGQGLNVLAHQDLLVTSIFLMWVSALACSVLNRVPYTVALIPVINHISATGVNVEPLWWALALGVGLGGNATPIGTTAGIAMMSISERTAHPIDFKTWFKAGIVVTLATTLIGTLILTLLFTWYT